MNNSTGWTITYIVLLAAVLAAVVGCRNAPGAPGGNGETEPDVPMEGIRPNPLVDKGSSHSLQNASTIHVDIFTIREEQRDRGVFFGVNALVYGDFNGDGNSDIFYAPFTGTLNRAPVEMYIGDGTGKFSFSAEFFGPNPRGGVHPRKALPGDFNGDGKNRRFRVIDQWTMTQIHSRALITSWSCRRSVDTCLAQDWRAMLDSITAERRRILMPTETSTYLSSLPSSRISSLTTAVAHSREQPASIQGVESQPMYTAELVDVDSDGYVDLLVAGHEFEGFRHSDSLGR